MSPNAASRERHDAGTILAALEDQLDCYRRLAELAAEQTRHVNSGETEKLLAVLQRRQGYADSVAELERELSEVKRGWPGSVARWRGPDRDRAEALFAEARELLEAITTRDAQDMLALEQRRQVVASQLNQSQADERTVRQINRRYAAAAYTGGPRQQMDVRR